MILERLLLLVSILLVSPVDGDSGSSVSGEAARLNREGVARLARRDYDAAVGSFRAALFRLEDSPPIVSNLRQALLGRGVARCNAGEAGAEEDLREAVALGPDDPVSLRNLGFCLLRGEKWVDAISALDRAVALDPSSADAFVARGQALYRIGRLTEAIASLEAAIRLDPEREGLAAPLEKARREHGVESRFAQENSSLFVVSFDGDREDPAAVSTILSDLEEVAVRIGLDLEFAPTSRVPVLLYSAEEFVTVTNSHDWVGGLFDGKIRVPLKNAAGHLPDLRRTLAHEYTHYVVSMLSPRAPAWLNEGLAQWEEAPGAPLAPDRVALLVAARDGDRLDRIASLAPSFSGVPDKDRVRLLYAQSHAFTSYLVDRFGMSQVRSLVVATRTAPSVSAAFEVAFGEGLLSVEDAWRASF